MFKDRLKIFTNKVTRNAIFFTLVILLVYRIGSFVPSPGINAEIVANLQNGIGSDVSTLFNFFGGGSIGRMTIFALGVSPYITASIIIQLLENELVPAMNEWKHQGVEGQNKRSNYTKNLALIIAFLQAIGITFGLSQTSTNPLVQANSYNINTESFWNFLNYIPINYFIVALIMTAGTAFLIWLADRITENGIGNGMSVMIMAGILASMPSQLNQDFVAIVSAEGMQTIIQLIILAIISIITIIVIIMVIYYNLANRKINVNYVRSGRSNVRKNSYLPIKLNPAGVIPVMFAGPFLLIISICTNLILKLDVFSANGSGWLESLAKSFSSPVGNLWFIYIIVYATLIILFSVFYSIVQMNPENMAENLQKQSAYIIDKYPNGDPVRPGESTEIFLSETILRTSIWGGSVLAIIAVLPIVISSLVTTSVSMRLLGTGIIIIVSVLVQVHQSLINKTEAKNYRYLVGGRE